jgi:phosphotransferase system enzyme I (PtsI)
VTSDDQVIVVAHELSPGLTVQLDREHVVGLVSEEGTRTAHAAILAHSLGIPAVMGASGALATIPNGAMLLLDGQSGIVVLDPTRDELEEAKTQLSRRHKLELQLEGVVDQPAVTPGGRPILLMGNVDLPEEIESALRMGAQGVGLLRHRVPPDRPGHRADRGRAGRVLPPGAAAVPRPDRDHPLLRPGRGQVSRRVQGALRSEPVLGWRSIRSASTSRQCSVPRSGPSSGPRWAGRPAHAAAGDEGGRGPAGAGDDGEEAASLRRRAVGPRAEVPVGVMIETPASVAIADRLAEVSAFFSVGTNDLTQYTLAVDRGNARLADRFTRTTRRSCASCIASSRWAGGQSPVSVCGEMASEALSAVLLIGLGYDRLSVLAARAAAGEWVVRTVPRRRPRRPRPKPSPRRSPRTSPKRSGAWSASSSTSVCSIRNRRCRERGGPR